MKNLSKTLAILIFAIFIISCSKDEDSISSSKDVYVGGFIVNSDFIWVATIWKNGVATSVSDGTQFAVINDITVVGNDVYAVGYESQPNGKNFAKIWKNGLGINLSDGLNSEEAIAIKVVGNDIYVTGFQDNSINNIRLAKVWKNGNATTLESTNTPYSSDNVTNITVSGSDVYVTGYKNNGTEAFAKFWKNGTAFNLTNGTTNARANDILILGTDVYVVGRISFLAKCWKNNQLISNLFDETAIYEATKIVNEGSDIYVLGSKSVNSIQNIRLWKNGIAIDFPNSSENLSPSGLAISGSDNFVSASRRVGSKSYAVYYKNQEKIELVNDAIISSYANAIFVK